MNVPAGVTTFPPLTIVSNPTDRLLRPCVDGLLLTESLLAGDGCFTAEADLAVESFLPAKALLPAEDFLPAEGFLPLERFLLGNGGQRAIEHVQSEVRILGRDAHRRLDTEHITIEPALPHENAHFARDL